MHLSPAPDQALRARWAVPLAGMAGAGQVLAYPGYSWWWTAPLSVALLAVAVRRGRAATAAGLGFVHGLALLVPLLHWTGIQVGWLPWLALASMEAGFHALAGVLVCLTQRSARPALRVAGGAAAWVAVEAAQARLPFGGFAWSSIAFSQASAPFGRLAALGGAPAVTFAVAVAGLLLVEAARVGRVGRRTLRAGRGPDRPTLERIGWVAAAVVVGGSGLLVPLPVTTQAGYLQVAGVQGNVPRMGLEFNAERRAVLDNHARVTRDLAESVRAGSQQSPDLVVWPENSSDIDPFTNSDAYRVIDSAVGEIGAPTLVGTLVKGADGRYRNTVLDWRPGVGPVARYEKRQPVPFAEYVPYRSFFRRISAAVDQAGDFAAGHSVGLLPVTLADGRQVPVGVLICFEVVDDDLVRDVVDAGAQLIIVPTNNATFGFTDESRQQLAISRLRAIETGRAVAQVSTVGVSGLILPDGTVVSGSTLFTATTVAARLPLRTTKTLATRLGTTHEWALTAFGLLVAATGLRRRRQEQPR